MTDTPPAGAGTPDEQQTPPVMRLLTQYVKDLSFENPGAPGSLTVQGAQPEINVGVDVKAQKLGDNEFESEIKISIEAKRGEVVTFIVELAYAGLFHLSNVRPDMVQPIVLMECPRLLFPFARRIISDVTRDGGFAPLMLEPIDFSQLYRQQLEQRQAELQGGPQISPNITH